MKKKKTPSTVSTKGPTKRCSFAASQKCKSDPTKPGLQFQGCHIIIMCFLDRSQVATLISKKFGNPDFWGKKIGNPEVKNFKKFAKPENFKKPVWQP